MNVEELRAAFTLGISVKDRARSFQVDRSQMIRAGRSPVPVQGPSRLVIHLLPLAGFIGTSRIDVGQAYAGRSTFMPPEAGGFNSRINFDGLVVATTPDDTGAHWSYTQVFHNGTVETVIGDIVRSDPTGNRRLDLVEQDKFVLSALFSYTTALLKLGMEAPYIVMVSLLGVREASYQMGWTPRHPASVDRDDLLAEPILVEHAASEDEWKRAIAPVSDSIWNGFGYARSETFRDGSPILR